MKELSGGSVECRVYADGTLFSSENEWDAISMGQADLAYISFPTLSTQPGLEWCAMVDSGYFWSSYDHMTNTERNELLKVILEKIDYYKGADGEIVIDLYPRLPKI